MRQMLHLVLVGLVLGMLTQAAWCAEIPPAKAQRIANDFVKRSGWDTKQKLSPQAFSLHDRYIRDGIRPSLSIEAGDKDESRTVVINSETGEVLGAALIGGEYSETPSISSVEALTRAKAWLRRIVPDLDLSTMRLRSDYGIYGFRTQSVYHFIWQGWNTPNGVWTSDRVTVNISYKTGQPTGYSRFRDPFAPAPTPKVPEKEAIVAADSYIATNANWTDVYRINTPAVTADVIDQDRTTHWYALGPRYVFIVHYETIATSKLGAGHILDVFIDTQDATVLGYSTCM